MKCPFCYVPESKVIDTRASENGISIKRRRECISCGRKFTTYERVEDIVLMVVKKDNWLKRSWNKFLNKVNGDKRYTNYVINPLNKKIRDINYKNMPPIRKQMSDKTARIKKSSKEKIANLEYIDVTKDNNIENQEPVAKVKISEKTYRTIISTARGEIGWRNTKALEKVHSSKQKKMKTVEEKELDK